MRPIHVPMNILLAYGTPYTHVLHGKGALDDADISLFFDGVQECVNRWAHYLSQQVIEGSHEMDFNSPVSFLHNRMLDLTEEDGPEVFNLRRDVHHAILDFEHLCTDMARSFSHPPRIKDFYHNLGSRARATFERLTEGGV